MKKNGYFVISLDFELYWGMTDARTLEEYGENIRGVRTAIPRMLKLFTEYGIHATWATVGMLMARNKAELMSLLPPPELKPVYNDSRLSSYEYLKTAPIGNDEHDDPYHFGSSLVELIKQTPNQELANHTFSHYYCIEGGDARLPETLRADLAAHARACAAYGVTTGSIVFPRNQVSDAALRISAECGIHAYRGTEDHFLYRARKQGEQSRLIRALRLLDHYINLSGHHTYTLPRTDARGLVNIPASRFLRPFMPYLSFLERLRLRRIKRAMTHAAKNGEVFHLWSHPHNFGIDQEQNFKNLTIILNHYKMLRARYGFESISMAELTNSITR